MFSFKNGINNETDSGYLNEWKTVLQAASGFVSMPLYFLFWGADLIYAPDRKWQFLFIRFFIVPMNFFVLYRCKRMKTFTEARLLGFLTAFGNGILISIMIFLTSKAESPYYAGLNLAIVATVGTFPFNIRDLVLASALILCPYYLVVCWNGLTIAGLRALALNSFFLFGTVAVSRAVRWHQERLRFQEQIARKELKEAFLKLQNAQVSLVQSEKLASLGVLTAGIGHELNNSMNFVSGAIGPIEKRLQNLGAFQGSTEILELFNGIKRGVTLSVKIIQNLKNYSSQDKISFIELDLLGIFVSLKGMLNSKLDNRINLELKIPKGFMVNVNMGGIHELFMNLISNSIDAIIGKGTITATATRDAKRWYVTLEDTGSGIPTDLLEKIFDPFFTTKPVGKGTGLGLFVVRKEVEHHGGTLKVESEVGRGTRFMLSFPFKRIVKETV